MKDLMITNAMDIILNAEENSYSGEYFDLTNSLGWLQRAIKENPAELIEEIDKTIKRLEEKMVDFHICTHCGGEIYTCEDGRWRCERCGERYDELG